MSKAPVVAALVWLPLLAACATPYSPAPLATNFPTSRQSELQAAAHWNVIAGDVAKQLSMSLKDRPPLFVNQTAVKTQFDRAFSNLLISSLVADGFTVQKTPVGALNVDVDTQAVQFSANRPKYNYAGLPTALVAGVWALNGANAATAATVAVASADAYSWFHSEFATGETPKTEILVTTSISNSGQYLARNSSVYYVADSDQALYQSTGLGVRTIPLTGGQ